MLWVRRAQTALVGCMLVSATFAGCSGDAFNQGGAGAGGGAGGSGANSGEAGETTQAGTAGTGGTSSNGGSSKGGTGSTSGGQAGFGGAIVPLGGRPSGGSTGGGSGGSAGAQPVLPTDGLELWFMSDEGVKVENGLIVSWEDQSGNGLNATVDDPEEAPKLTSADSLPLPVVELDGKNDHLHIPANTLDFSQGLSFFAVAGRNAESECSGLLELTTSDAETDDISFDSINQGFQFEVYGDTIYAAEGSFPTGELRLIEVVQSTDPLKPMAELFSNGAAVGGGKVGTPKVVERIDNHIGDSSYSACYPFPGAIGEIMLYSRKLSVDERKAVEQYLREKWECCQ